MTFDLQRILAGKRALRQKLAALPVADKLRLLDDLRERAMTLRRATGPSAAPVVREESARYRADETPSAASRQAAKPQR